jgi:hypothetical protein
MGEIPSRFTGDEPVDDPAGGGDEAEVGGEEDEESKEVAGDVAPQHDDGQELLGRREEGADDHERDGRLHRRAPAGG